MDNILKILYFFLATQIILIHCYWKGKHQGYNRRDVVWGGVIHQAIHQGDSLKRFAQRITQLYEQGADEDRIGEMCPTLSLHEAP